MKEKVVLGMSGGVDSSVAALLLKKKGYEVYGLFMNCNVKGGKTRWPSSIDWQEEQKTLEKICERLGIKLFVVDTEMGYENKIITPMVADYEKGKTPNPDILCNDVGKFPLLLKKADEIGARFIATGHYARVKKNQNHFDLLMGKDKTKDQSYFICTLDQKTLSRTLFPIGNLKKEEVRKKAKQNNFPNWNKTGSRGICYLGKIDVKSFLKKRIKEKKGDILDAEGNNVGQHPGIMFFTTGERVRETKGLQLNEEFSKQHREKLYIAEKHIKDNTLVIVPENHPLLKRKKVILINFKKLTSGKNLKARIRHLGKLYSGTLKKEKGNQTFEFDTAIEGLAEGQFLVIYSGEKVVAYGEISF